MKSDCRLICPNLVRGDIQRLNSPCAAEHNLLAYSILITSAKPRLVRRNYPTIIFTHQASRDWRKCSRSIRYSQVSAPVVPNMGTCYSSR
jgi:hypothetical protein